jgi:hypothetical protein
MQLKFPRRAAAPRRIRLRRHGHRLRGGGLRHAARRLVRAWRASVADALHGHLQHQRAGAEPSFTAENDAAMARMMAGMSIKPSGSVDRDFADMMIAHHQGAIDMAQAELRHGSNEQLRRIAQEIIVEQQQEIAAMRLALGQPLPPSAPAPTQVGRLSRRRTAFTTSPSTTP